MHTAGRHVTGFSSSESLERANRRPLAAFSFAPGYRPAGSHTRGGSMSKRTTFAVGKIVGGVIIWLRRTV
jgi:hypothetical protein